MKLADFPHTRSAFAERPSDIDGYVKAVSQKIDQIVKFPPGYYIQWAGQFQYLQEAKKRLAVLVPFTLLTIFVLLYLNTDSVTRTLIVLLSVPFSLVGAFWLLYLLGYNISVAVWVGLIALVGLDAETGVVMLLYLDQAYKSGSRSARQTNKQVQHQADPALRVRFPRSVGQQDSGS
jgi:copper/silver efflux system protein